MTPTPTSERAFEDAIECGLLRWGPDACPERDGLLHEPPAPPYGDGFAPGSYHRRTSDTHYDRTLCLIPRDVIDFLVATQPRTWNRLKQHHGANVRKRFLSRLARELDRRGALDVFRKGIKDSGCKFDLAYFRPASGLNEETRRLHAANLFSVIRQLRFSAKTEQSVDMALFLNGIPFCTAELKNPLTGQNVEKAILQYRNDRDPARAALRPPPLPRALRRRPELGLHHHPPQGPEDPLPALQPRQVRRRRQSPRPSHPTRIRHGLPLGRGLGAGQRPRSDPPVHSRGEG